jgi:gliding motility-associated-like protein
LANTNYTVTGTTNGCSNTISTFVVVEPSPTLTINSASVCTGQNASLNVSGANSYVWNTGSALSSIIVAPPSTTIYTVTGTTANCSTTATTTVMVSALPVLTVASQTICSGQSATLTATGATTYSWNTGAISPQIVVNPLNFSTFTVTGINGGCSNSTTVTVTVYDLPVAAFVADTLLGCAPLCVKFTNLSSVTQGTINSVTWTFGATETSILNNPTHCFNSPGMFNVALTVIADNGCRNSITHYNMINVFNVPTAEFTSNAEDADVFEPIVNFLDKSSTDVVSYSWNFGDLSVSDQKDPTHVYNQEGIYTTTLVAINQNGCTDTVRHQLKIKGLFTFYAPNAFTPNEDGRNDVFLPLGTGWNADEYELSIFDRWGTKCFFTKDVNLGWNGKANNGALIAQQDAYTWKVELTDVFGKFHSFIGSVILLK